MNDYKELIEALRIDEMFDAAKAIEQLVKERDAAIADFGTFAKTALDNPFACNFCKHEAGEHCKWKSQNRFDRHGCFGRHFEWRGVQEDK